MGYRSGNLGVWLDYNPSDFGLARDSSSKPKAPPKPTSATRLKTWERLAVIAEGNVTVARARALVALLEDLEEAIDKLGEDFNVIGPEATARLLGARLAEYGCADNMPSEITAEMLESLAVEVGSCSSELDQLVVEWAGEDSEGRADLKDNACDMADELLNAVKGLAANS